ncbi:hypothetical protein HNQ07_003758 [Deinococcus metalli]|uniref:Lipoprotein n=1 Tax=Deinococcus metalli TaxID=1141878 RepID=A0A7W8KHM0_9DEIO|nr:hypothetical protein [Deinococcus metalli]MBB5378257.1 hypothetical protein [Deinococcus metalli]GHF57222.1 hypothetical protein GCM10017781_36960 [Deinococcus metalli]
MTAPKLTLLLGCALLLASCGGGGTPAVQPPLQPSQPAVTVSSVSGVVVENASTDAGIVTGPWSGGAGSVSGEVTVGSGTTATTETLTTADLAADGQFTLPLPASVDGAKLHAFTGSYFDVGAQYPADSGTSTACTGAPTLSSSAAHGITLAVKVKAAKAGTIAPLALGSDASGAPSIQIGSVVYVDAPLTVVGTVTCTSTYAGLQVRGTVTYDLNLASGWNQLTIKESSGGVSSSGGTSTQDIVLSSGALPTNQWMFSPYTAVTPVGPGSLPRPAR